MGAGEIITILGLLLTLVALIAAIWQLRQASDQTKQLLAIQQSLSTQFLGLFPDFNEEIAELIKTANSSVEVFCDLPGYGMITNNVAWFRINSEIQNAKERGIRPRMNFFDQDQRRKIIVDQATQIETSGGDMTSDFKSALEKIFDTKIQNFSASSFVENCLMEHSRIIENEFRGSDIEEIRANIPIYFWLVDDREAIISIPVYSEEITEYGFKTRDISFISALKSIRERTISAVE